MTQTDKWSELKAIISEELDYESETLVQELMMGLGFVVGNLAVTYGDKIHDAIDIDQFESKLLFRIGDICWYIIALEDIYNLPNSLHTRYLHTDIEKRMDPEQKSLEDALADLFEDVALVMRHVMDNELLELQYVLNQMVFDLFQLCMFHKKLDKLLVRNCLHAEIEKMKAVRQQITEDDLYYLDPKTKKEINKQFLETFKEYKEDTKEYKELIKSKNVKEFYVEMITDNEGKHYGGLQVEYGWGRGRKKIVFFEHDVIIDFFAVANHKKEHRPKDVFNLGPKFRLFMDESDSYNFMYLDGERDLGKLVSNNEIIKRYKNCIIDPEAEGDQQVGQFLVQEVNNVKLDTFDKLLNYVNSVRKYVSDHPDKFENN